MAKIKNSRLVTIRSHAMRANRDDRAGFRIEDHGRQFQKDTDSSVAMRYVHYFVHRSGKSFETAVDERELMAAREPYVERDRLDELQLMARGLSLWRIRAIEMRPLLTATGLRK